MMAWLLAAFLLGLGAGTGAGAGSLWFWLRRDIHGGEALSSMRRARRRDRVREAVVLARESVYGQNEDRALKWARRAVRLDRCHAEAYAVLGTCLQSIEHYGQAIRHHRRAEELATENGRGAGAWRLQNAVDAVQACSVLRSEAPDDQAQDLWDEAHAWTGLAYELNADEAQQLLQLSPWLASLTGGAAWLQP